MILKATTILIAFYVLCCLIVIPRLPVYAQAKKLTIEGTKIYDESELFKRLKLTKDNHTGLSSRIIISRIKKFYTNKGYSLVKIYILTATKKELALYVDEGRLGKIIFKDIDEFNLMRVRYYFSLKKNIFNTYNLKKNIKILKKKLRYKKISYKLIAIKNYKKSTFQFDRKFSLPIIGKTQLPFFDKIGKRYDLEISLYKRSNSRSDKDPKYSKRNSLHDRFGFKLRLHYTKGFIPELYYYDKHILQKKDSLIIKTSTGIMYGIDQKFDEYPHMTFFEVKGVYDFAPIYKKYFTPRIKGTIYRSHASRSDIGIESFRYWQHVYILAPGVTFFRKLHIYTGTGIEIISFDNCSYDPESDYQVYITNRTDVYNILETQIKFELIPFRIGSPIKKVARATYDYYFPDEPFHTIKIEGEYDYEFNNRSIFSIISQYCREWGAVPFHHEEQVKNSAFYGLTSYYTRHNFAITTEYRLSLYKDYIYLGAFFGFTAFEGSGYDLEGQHTGYASGPTLRILLLDHYEFYLDYVSAVLLPEKEREYSLNLALTKRW